jgi:GNAT superfamily N-acetyltransferase
MSTLEVRKVSTEAENQAFLRMPWTVYKGDPNWVAPLWRDHMAFFDPAQNPELGHIDFERFVAWRDDRPVGTVIAHVNHLFNQFQEENVGWFGQFELLDDPEAADALLAAAEEWVRERGLDAIRGPATFSTNSEIGVLVDGFDTPPQILMMHAKPYYHSFIEARGYQKIMDMYSYFFDGHGWGGRKADKIPEKLERVVGLVRKRRPFVVRRPNMRRLDEEVEHVKAIYNAAWEKNWGFVPMTEPEVDKLAEDLKSLVDPDVTFVVEVDGKAVAFGLPLPDLYEPLRKAHCRPGEPHWWQLLRLLWHWKIAGRVTGIRAWGLGVLKEYRGTGIDALLYYEMIKAGLGKGYMNITMGWILENNDMMNRGARMLGAEVYKTYRVYEKPL